MGRWRGVLVGGLLLGLGVVIGAGGAVALVARQARLWAEDPARVRTLVVEQIDRQYGLSEEQKARVRAVVDARFEALRKIRLEAQPRVRAEVDRLEEEVAAELAPGQAGAWRARIRALRARIWLGR